MADFLTAGNVLLIRDFRFKDGTTRNKILIVLHVANEEAIVISALTTSKDFYLPEHYTGHGCWKNDGDAVHHYLFEMGREVGTAGGERKGFRKKTIVYMNRAVLDIPVQRMLEYHGQVSALFLLDEKELKRLIKCVLRSDRVKRKVKRLLGS